MFGSKPPLADGTSTPLDPSARRIALLWIEAILLLSAVPGLVAVVNLSEPSAELVRSRSSGGEVVSYRTRVIALPALAGSIILIASIVLTARTWRRSRTRPRPAGALSQRGASVRSRRKALGIIAMLAVPLSLSAVWVHEVPLYERIAIDHDEQVVSIDRAYLIRSYAREVPFDEIRAVILGTELLDETVWIVTRAGETITVTRGPERDDIALDIDLLEGVRRDQR